MRNSLNRTIAGSLAALIIGVAAIGGAAPASAGQLHLRGPHLAAMHGGWHGVHGWRGGGWAPFAVLGIAGLATAAIAASQEPYYQGCTALRPVYDADGVYMGQRPVNVCQ